MLRHANDEGVFIRSMASRGWAGGLSAAVSDAIRVLDASGKDLILVETVGIGQADVEIMKVTHAVAVVVMPSMGDEIQVSKAGLMEIADVYVVNKGDLEGADLAALEILRMVRESRSKNARPPVVKVSALKNEGMDELAKAIDQLKEKMGEEEGRAMRVRSTSGMLVETAKSILLTSVERRMEAESSDLAEEVLSGTMNFEDAVKKVSRPPETHGEAYIRTPDMSARRERAIEMDNLAERLSEYVSSVRYRDLPQEVVVEAKTNVIDAFGCAIGAFDAEPVAAARRVAGAVRVNGSTVLGTRSRTTPDLASFVNGIMVRYFDFNDTYLSKEPGHPSDNIPACLAVAEAEGVGGRDLLLAMVLAYEVQSRLCDAADIRHRGWDHVCYGLVSASLAAGKLMGLSVEKMTQAVNIALNGHIAMRQVRAGELSDWKGCSFANAERNAVFSAQLAREGMNGPSPIFEGEMGFFKQVSGPFDLDTESFGGRKGRFKLLETYVEVLPRRVSCAERHLGRLRASGPDGRPEEGARRCRSTRTRRAIRSWARTRRSGSRPQRRRRTTAFRTSSGWPSWMGG